MKRVTHKRKAKPKKDYKLLGRLLSLGLIFFVFAAIAFFVYRNKASAAVHEPSAMPHFGYVETELA